MLIDWLIATLAGIALGLALYGCVSWRMRFAPVVRRHFGNHARRLFWIVTIVVMIVLANAGLFGLRALLDGRTTAGSLLVEIWFALLALAVPMALIYRRMGLCRD